MSSTEVWRLLCYVNVVRCWRGDVREAAESDPDAIRTCLSHDFRGWTEDQSRTVLRALEQFQEGGEGLGLEIEMAELRKFLQSRLDGDPEALASGEPPAAGSLSIQ